MSLSAKRIGKSIFSFVAVAGLVYYLWRHWDVFHATLDASWYHILGLVIIILMTWMLNCCQVVLLLRQLGVKVGYWENMSVFVAMILGNYLPMRTGSLLRMHYFKRVHGLQYAKFGSIIGVRTLILITSAGILGVVGMTGLIVAGVSLNVPLLSVFVGMTLLPLGVYLVPTPRVENRKNFFWKLGSDFLSGIDLMRSRPLLLWQITGLILMQFAMLAMRLYITFDAIQVQPSVWVLLILAPMTTLISFLSLTPGNLGLREWAIGIISLASGIDFRSGIFAGTLDRAVLMACTFLFGAISLVYIWSRVGGILRNNSRKQG